jgi:hypothetical protein
LFNTGLFDPRAKSLDVQRWLNDDAYDTAQDRDHAHPADDADDAHAHHDETDAHVDRNRHDKHIASFCLTFDDPLPGARSTRGTTRLPRSAATTFCG